MPRITPAQAAAELTRRALPKSDPARSVRPADHILRASGPELHALAAKATKAAPAPKKAAPKGENAKTKRANASGAARGTTAWWDAYHGRTTPAPAQGKVTRMGEDFAAQEWAALPAQVRRALLDSVVSNDAARIPA